MVTACGGAFRWFVVGVLFDFVFLRQRSGAHRNRRGAENEVDPVDVAIRMLREGYAVVAPVRAQEQVPHDERASLIAPLIAYAPAKPCVSVRVRAHECV